MNSSTVRVDPQSICGTCQKRHMEGLYYNHNFVRRTLTFDEWWGYYTDREGVGAKFEKVLARAAWDAARSEGQTRDNLRDTRVIPD